jgi:adenosylcobyric acid synthase
MPAKTIMIQGTGSHVGKSVITAGLCRILKQDGFRVAPFKAQNMSNNSYVTRDGGEIGRAQAVQAEASGIEPSIHMNPILLKPSSDLGAQVIVHGKPVKTMQAKEYQFHTSTFINQVRESLNYLMNQYEVVVIEGAGSPAEINLQDYDIVNMRTAEMADAPVILVGDIDRGGVFAAFVGTLELLPPHWREHIQAFLINKFRGDISLLQNGIDYLMGRTQIPTLGVIPYDSELRVMEEDGLSEERIKRNGRLSSVPVLAGTGFVSESNKNLSRNRTGTVLIDIIWLPRISNFTDFHDLDQESDVQVTYLREIPNRLPDILIIPGTKSTIADLEYLRELGFDQWIKKCAKHGTLLVGICGGFQMLGNRIIDSEHMESNQSETKGLGLIPSVTVFETQKTTKQVKVRHLESGIDIDAYEIHMGKTKIEKSVIHDGIFYRKDNIWGTYLHGIFDSKGFRDYFLNRFRKKKNLISIQPKNSEDPYDHLANLIRSNIDLSLFYKILNKEVSSLKHA